ncbi:hypothetical protein N656DRAFT_707011 [Canariomyces notabilis]|uniref:Uncharacterized protein n=1 Tax=Canariomyces notabilis TaxID=2074819 RepID=A0AAN6YTZ3_9PEZI|nr:hypothetical protein N656DRAFT_707011 [Canariomyces arenarius]
MCLYYAHAFSCKHMTFSFARFCGPASMIQTPCGERRIWQTIPLDELCDDCKGGQGAFPDDHFQQQQQQQRYSGRQSRSRR